MNKSVQNAEEKRKNMPIPNTKQKLKTAIQDSYTKLLNDLNTVPETSVNKVELPGHAKDTTMSVSNLIAYLIGWGELALKWHEKHQKKEEIDFPETGYKWNELGGLAQKFYTDYADKSYPELLNLFEGTKDKILDLIESKSNTELYETPFYNKHPLGRMIQWNTSSPYKNARIRVRKYLKSIKE